MASRMIHTFRDGLSNFTDLPLAAKAAPVTVGSSAGVTGEGKLPAPLILFGLIRISSSTSSSWIASLLGAGVRLELDPRAGLKGFFDAPLAG